MRLYLKTLKKISPIKEAWFKLEKDMQWVVEENLDEFFWLLFLETEFQLNNLRIDTLAFDQENNSFVIIEYKRWSSFSVIDQGFSYMALLLNNKADFILQLQKRTNKFYKKDDIDWSQTRVIFIADAFTRYQQESINFKDLPIELWEMKSFDEDIITLNPIRASETSESIKTVTKLQWINKEVEKEIQTYNIDDRIKENWIETRELFEQLEEQIYQINPNLDRKINKYYIAYKNGSRNFIVVHIFKSWIEIHFVWLHKSELLDVKSIMKDIPMERGWWKITSLFIPIADKDIFQYALDLLRQANKKVRN